MMTFQRLSALATVSIEKDFVKSIADFSHKVTDRLYARFQLKQNERGIKVLFKLKTYSENYNI